MVGKNIDAVELASYRRSSYYSSNSIMDWAKRIAVIGSSIVGVTVLVFGIGRFTARSPNAPKRMK
jgi:hypothetical protein